MKMLFECRHLKRHFGGLWATNGVNLGIAENETHALIGPNGAGKTTLVNLISGVTTPHEGQILFAGQDITHLSMHHRVKLGIARSFQITQIFPHLSVLENVRLGIQARPNGLGSGFNFWRPASADFSFIEEAEEWLGRVGLAEHAGMHAEELSHGGKRALELAMTLATKPRLLLLDEPMAGMGPEESQHMADLIASFKGIQTILLIEHDMDIVFRLADRISVLASGNIIATGLPEEIRTNPTVRSAYLGDDTQ